MIRAPNSLRKEADRQLRRISELASISAARTRRQRRRMRLFAKRVVRAITAFMAVGVVTTFYALLGGPIGIGGFMLAFLIAFTAMAVFFIYPRPATLEAQTSGQASLDTLIDDVENWLDRKRRKMPASASRQIDTLMLRLEPLKSGLSRIDPASTLAGDARRLLSRHLPRLVESYASISARNSVAGTEADTRFIEGIAVIHEEVERLAHRLTEEEVHLLRIEGRFLQSRYSGSEEQTVR